MNEPGPSQPASRSNQTRSSDEVRSDGHSLQFVPHILDSISEAIVATDFEGNVIYWNPAAERLYGWTAEESIGRNILELMDNPDDRSRTADALDDMRGRDDWTRDLVVPRKDGTTFPAQVNLSQIRDGRNEVIGVVGVTTDSTERKRAERRLAIQYSVSSLLAGATDFESVAEDLLAAICSQVDWDWSALWIVDESEQVLRCAASWPKNDETYSALFEAASTWTFGPETGLLGKAWTSGEPVWSTDIGSAANFVRKEPALGAGLRSAMAVPIRLGSHEVHGVVELLSRNVVEPDDDLLDMVVAAARQMGLFLDRQRAQRTLRENEERLHRLEDSNLIGILRSTIHGRIISANDAFLNMLGYTRDDLDRGLRWDELTPPEWQHVNAEILDDLLTTGRSQQREKEYFHKDGSRVAVLIGVARVRPDSQEAITFVVNISARKQAEKRVEESLLRERAARRDAAAALERAERLLDVTAAFSRARTPEEVAQVTINEGIAVLGARAGAFTLLNDARDKLELVEHRGYLPDSMQSWHENPVPIDSGYPLTECVVRGESIWVGSHEEMFERFPAMAAVNYPFSASIVALPLMANGRPIGALNLGFSEPHDFTAPERVFVETLVQFCSQALERSWLFAAEQNARREADAAQQRAERLFEITAALSRALTPREVAEVTIEQGLDALGVDGGVVALLNEDSNALEVIHSRGYPQEIVDRWTSEDIPVEMPVPLADAVHRGEPVWIYSQQELFERYPLMAERSMVLSEAHASLPLIAGHKSYGVLGLSYTSPRTLGHAERTYARTLARLSSQALERAMLFSRERDARVAAEESQEQLALLARAGELLTGGQDTNTTLTLIAQLIVPDVADWCVIDLVDDSGVPNRLTVMHVDPEKVRWAEDLQRRYPYDPDATTGIAKVLRTGKPEFYPFISDEMISAAARDEEHLQMIRAVGFSSAMIVPLIARGRSLGAITLVFAESGRHYTEADLTVIGNVAYRAALAVDNARLFEAAQRHTARLNAIAEASRAFAEVSLDQTAILETLSRQVAHTIGDWVVIRLVSEDRKWLDPVAIFHPDPEAESALREMFALEPLSVGEGLTGQVAQTGESVLVSDLDPAVIRNRVKPEYRHWLERYAAYAVLIVPMRRRNEVIGTIALFQGEPARAFSREDRQLLQEIADRAALAVENAQLYNQAQEAVRVREEFLSIASHEMRTPLTTITGFAHLLNRQVMRGQVDDERIGTITNRLLSEAQRLDQLVADLLDVTRIQQGRLVIRPEPCDLSQIVNEVASRLREAQDHEIERDIVVRVPESLTGNWDRSRVDQIVTNLLSNALKYSVEGEIIIAIHEADDDTAVLSVQDHGIGIAPNDLAHLFDPYVRGEAAHYTASGTGLGLYITRQIAELHGGDITVQSEPGKGSTFTVRLPLQPVYDSE